MATLRISNIEAKADGGSPSIDEKVTFKRSTGENSVVINAKQVGVSSVGINSDNPRSALDIVGDVNITGSLNTTSIGGLVGLGYTYGNYSNAIQHTGGTTYSDTLMQAEITPSSTSSKIHVSGTIQLYAQGGTSSTLIGMQVAVTRNKGDGAGNIIQNVKGWGRQPYQTVSGTQILQGTVSFDFIDSPGSVGIVTYKVFVNSANTTFTYYSHAYADYANLTTQIFDSNDYIVLQEIEVL